MNTPGSRWDTSTPMGKNYSSTYLKPSILGATQRVANAAKAAGLDGHALALRWAIYHSHLDGKYGDAVILGASSLEQLEANLNAADAGPLDEDMVKMVEGVWEVVKGEGEAAPYYL